jgi:site-specific DNA recombinase
MASYGKDPTGRIRIRCSAARESGTCSDPKSFYLDTVENAVVAGLKSELQHPAVITEYVKAYHEERKRLASRSIENRSRLERWLGELDREIKRLVDAIAKGLGDPVLLGPRSTALNEERKQVRAELTTVPETPNVVALHPAALARYEEQLERLQKALAAGIASGDSEGALAMHGLVETVTVFRDPANTKGVMVEITGRLNALLGEATYPNGVRALWVKVVAEVRVGRSPRHANALLSFRSD